MVASAEAPDPLIATEKLHPRFLLELSLAPFPNCLEKSLIEKVAPLRKREELDKSALLL